jgi:hypothetical protein
VRTKILKFFSRVAREPVSYNFFFCLHSLLANEYTENLRSQALSVVLTMCYILHL